MHRYRILLGLAGILALTACTPDAGERIMGPQGPASTDELHVAVDSIIVETAGGNAFGSGT